ncbi:MAG: hypothetical protein COB35_05485 [Gammaproteobacteria bacterium]|nr:MAG: hypothetical protein COB35_05485 [Gammaproteobacteria bacterium]
MMKLSIVYKLSISSIFLVLFSVGIVGSVFYHKIKEILVADALEHISEKVDEASALLQLVVKVDQEDVLFLASTPPFQGIIRASLSDGVDQQDTTNYEQWTLRLQTIFESYIKQKNNYLKISYIDIKGNELVSVFKHQEDIIRVKKDKLQNKSHHIYVQETLKLPLDKVYISQIMLNREYGKVITPHEEILNISTPIYNEKNHNIAGLVVITINIRKELHAIEKHITNNDDTIICITNDQGDYLLHRENNKTYGFDLGTRYRIQSDVPQLSSLYESTNTVKQVMLMPEDTGNKRVISFTKIPFDSANLNRFIAVVITQSFSNIMAEDEIMLKKLMGLTILLTLGGLVLAVLFSIRLTRPIHQMTLAVNQYRENYLAKIEWPTNNKDEIGMLARSFKEMIDQIEYSRLQLEEMNMSLESKVKQRTHDLKQALADAEFANKAKSAFLSCMSHELRTPLNAILGFGQILELDAEKLDETQRSNINEILEAGRYLLQLINDILDLARIESGQMKVMIKEVNIDDVIQDAISLIQPLAKSRNITLTYHQTEQYHNVEADPIRLKQVLMNLLSNAVKYNRENGHVELSCSIIDKQHFRISVTDTGEGLNEESIAKLFVPFERLDKDNNVDGTGIGLIISKHFIEAMNGTIAVECTLGEGCTFSISLQLVV